jgi:hypothetical protein
MWPQRDGVTKLAFVAVDRYVAPMLSRFPSPALPAGFIEPCLPTRVAHRARRAALGIRDQTRRVPVRRPARRRPRARVPRHDKDWTDKVAAIVETLLTALVASATIDGEGVSRSRRGGETWPTARPARSNVASAMPSENLLAFLKAAPANLSGFHAHRRSGGAR